MLYKILTADSACSLETKINRHLSTNWVLQGGIAVVTNKYPLSNKRLLFAQAVTAKNVGVL